MARSVVDILWIEISSTLTGSKLLRSVKQVTIDEDDPNAEVVKTMVPERRAVGHRGGISDFSIELETVKFMPPEVDWKRLKDTAEVFQLRYQEASGKIGGDRYKLIDCKVIGIGKSGNAEAEVMETIKVLPLDHKKES